MDVFDWVLGFGSARTAFRALITGSLPAIAPNARFSSLFRGEMNNDAQLCEGDLIFFGVFDAWNTVLRPRIPLSPSTEGNLRSQPSCNGASAGHFARLAIPL